MGQNDRLRNFQVASSGAQPSSLPIEECEAGSDLADYRKLPTEKQYKALSAVRSISEGGSAFINPADAEECVDFAWLESVELNGWRLTVEGKRLQEEKECCWLTI